MLINIWVEPEQDLSASTRSMGLFIPINSIILFHISIHFLKNSLSSLVYYYLQMYLIHYKNSLFLIAVVESSFHLHRYI